MAKYILVGPSAAKEGRDDEYNKWYDDEHLRDVCSIPGVISGRRFEIAPTSPSQPDLPYLAIYEIESDDPISVLAELYRRASLGELHISPALDVSSSKMWLYKAL
jgi:hypothetical protein